MDSGSYGIGFGILNFQDAGGNDRGYNAVLWGAGPAFGQHRDPEVGRDPPERGHDRGRNRADGGRCSGLLAHTIGLDAHAPRPAIVPTHRFQQRATVFSDDTNLIAPTISRVCFYPLKGAVYVDNVSFSIDRRKPARYLLIGDSVSEGYNASAYSNAFISVIQSNFTQAVCNDSGSFNTTSNSVSLLPEILAHKPATAILMIGGNDIQFEYPTSQWQTNYSLLVTQLQTNGVKVKYCLPPPRTGFDLRPLINWITATYPAADVIDTFTPLVSEQYDS